MLARDDFKKRMKQLHSLDTRYNHALDAMSEYGISVENDLFDTLLCAYIDLMCAAMNDKEDLIGYYIFETCYGKTSRDRSLSSDSEFSAYTLDELYNDIVFAYKGDETK